MAESFPNQASAPTDGDGRSVAILMRTRDRPILLARAFASVLSQRWDDWHLFVVNDGGDPAPVDGLAARHATGFLGRITILHHAAPLGRQAAANAALAQLQVQALGTAERSGGFAHVALHDDDDTWHPDFLRSMTEWLSRPEHHAFAGVLSHWTVVREQLDRAEVREIGRAPAVFDMKVLALDAMLGRNRVPSIAFLFRSEAVRRAGRFDLALPVLEDWDFLLRLLALGDIGVLPRRLGFYHLREPGTLAAYVNSADDDASPHDAQYVRYRNNQLRALRDADPGALAVIGTLGSRAEAYHEQAELQHGRILANLDRNGLWGHARHEDLQHRLVRVEETLGRLEAALSALASRPPERSLFERALRRVLARWRRIRARG
ncbi:glycosyltransferase [Acetobacteraceae bacterium KSS8]|uniref:Glycosyltransferase n=1 Tax=Endosaccharibacter trunci TaxID=2812733 RepID=A0ABT1W6B9_9PROT|nr:glycosyltransferase [Acetobacteraceae bacterium KSS8]